MARANCVRATERARVHTAGVRERSATPSGCLGSQGHIPCLAHPSNRLIAQLNTSWRVVDDPLQWVLQHKKGNPRRKNPGWENRSFCTTRAGLLRCAREYCGEADPAALAALSALPEHHTDVEGGRSAQVSAHVLEKTD
jgi:hypothetical protein